MDSKKSKVFKIKNCFTVKKRGLLSILPFLFLSNPKITPSPSVFGVEYIGGSRSLAHGNPYYFTRKHTVESYRSQQRKSKIKKRQK